MSVDYNFFIHPQDKAALKTLQSIPMFDTIVKTYLKLFDERELRGINMATKIKLGPNQLPEFYQVLPETCSVLGIPEPEFFLEMDPNPNAYTFGDARPFVVVNSGLIDLLKRDELKAVIAHECGHILCRHVLYHSIGMVLLNIGSVGAGALLGGLSDLALAPVIWAFMYWMRRSELSSDRVAAYVMGDSSCVMRTMMRLSGGSARITENVNMALYEQQAKEYFASLDESKFNKFLQAWAIKDHDHPFPAVRCHEIKKWYEKKRGTLPNRLQII